VLEQLRLNKVDQLAVVPLFIDPMPKATPLRSGGPVLFSGRVVAAKGLQTFLRAAGRVEAEIEIVGDGWWMPKARRLAAKLGMEDRVAFRGWLTGEDLADAYRRARVVVVSSHWPEPFGIVGLEAMAHARPTIGSATGGIPEWLEDGVNGVLVAPGSVDQLAAALTALLTDFPRAAEMGARGAERVRTQFTAEQYQAALEPLYDLAIDRWRERRAAAQPHALSL
jgi:glycosyltransferase involved in cell wall biosynthesis